mmetsp:Transcript_80105/g.126547  ORF Transcript_80105/g.126547 Transcript_80105/m.126547 type:complete len:495 (-) Transcript_80105:161-1645(-)
MARLDEEQAVRKHLKVFVGSLPSNASEPQVGQHFAKYGQVLQVSIVPSREGDKARAPYAFVTFKFAADADCAVVDPQHFPGAQRPLTMGFATPKKKEDKKRDDALDGAGDPCKVFIGGIGERDSEEEVGDFFSQWGLVGLVYRDRAWGFVYFATKEGALRLLDEGSVIFQKRRLDVKISDSKKSMDTAEREDLIRRAIARHFHKKSVATMPPPGMHPGAPPGYPAPGYYGAPPGAPGYYGAPPGGAPPPGYYGAPPSGYYGGAPPPQAITDGKGEDKKGAPPGYPPSGYYGAPPAGYYGAPPPGSPQGAPPPGYPPSGYPPSGAAPGYQSPPGGGYYGAPPGGYYGAPPGGAPGAPPPSTGEPPRALPAPEYHQQPPASNDPYAGYYGAPQDGSGRTAAPSSAAPPGYPDYYRDSQGRDGRQDAPPSSAPPPSYAPGVDPYYRSSGPPPQGAAPSNPYGAPQPGRPSSDPYGRPMPGPGPEHGYPPQSAGYRPY